MLDLVGWVPLKDWILSEGAMISMRKRLTTLAFLSITVALLSLGCSKTKQGQPAAVDHAKIWSEKDRAGLDALSRNDLTGAEAQLLEALKEAEACGQSDPRVAGTLNNLGSVYEKKEMYAQAVPLLKRALRIFESTYGEKSKFLPVVLVNIGRVSAKAGQNTEAETAYARAVKLRTAPADADWKEALADYASVLKKLDKNDQAREVEAQASKIQ